MLFAHRGSGKSILRGRKKKEKASRNGWKNTEQPINQPFSGAIRPFLLVIMFRMFRSFVLKVKRRLCVEEEQEREEKNIANSLLANVDFTVKGRKSEQAAGGKSRLRCQQRKFILAQ